MLQYSAIGCSKVILAGGEFVNRSMPVGAGLISTMPLTHDTAYTLSASGSNGSGAFRLVGVMVSNSSSISGSNTTSVDLKANGSDQPAPVPYNSSATLTWTSTGKVSQCYITRKAAGDTYLVTGTGTLQTLPLMGDQEKFTISCNGGTVSDSVSISVLPGVSNSSPSAPTVSIVSPNGGTFQPNSQMTLNWSGVGNFDKSNTYYFVYIKNSPAQILGGNGFGITYIPVLFRSPTLSNPLAFIAPSNPGTYYVELDYTDTNGIPITSATSNAFVVSTGTNQTPTVTVTANPTVISAGQSSTVTWSSNTATCSVGNNASSGSEIVTPSQTTTYTVYCYNSVADRLNAAPSTYSSVTVMVNSQQPQVPVVTLTANPISITSGQMTTLSWSSTNAASCTLTNSVDPSKYGDTTTSGTLSTYGTGMFTMTCKNSVGQSASASVTVTVSSSSNTDGSLTLMPHGTITSTAGAPVTITVSGPSAIGCTYSGFAGGVGVSTVYPTKTTIYSVICGANHDSLTVIIPVSSMPLTPVPTPMPVTTYTPSAISVSVHVSPTIITSGGSVSISWSASGGSSPLFCSRSWQPNLGAQSVTGGTEYVSAITTSRSFSVSCLDAAGKTGSGSGSVTVQSSDSDANVYDSLVGILRKLGVVVQP